MESHRLAHNAGRYDGPLQHLGSSVDDSNRQQREAHISTYESDEQSGNQAQDQSQVWDDTKNCYEDAQKEGIRESKTRRPRVVITPIIRATVI